MIRRLGVSWPDRSLFRDSRDTLRLLAVSDVDDPALYEARNREELGRVDLILGCGDLEPDYLAFLGDAFPVPLLYVRGNHDFGAAWEAGSDRAPEAVGPGCVHGCEGLRVAGLPWPGGRAEDRGLDAIAAWRQAAKVVLAARRSGDGPLVVISHVPPRGIGDDESDHYHTGFSAYRRLAEHLRPPLWLHGHTPLAAQVPWHTRVGPTTFVNVTGAVLVELTPPIDSSATATGTITPTETAVSGPSDRPLALVSPDRGRLMRLSPLGRGPRSRARARYPSP